MITIELDEKGGFINFEDGSRIALKSEAVRGKIMEAVNEQIKTMFNVEIPPVQSSKPKTIGGKENSTKIYNFIARLFQKKVSDSDIARAVMDTFGLNHYASVARVRAFRKIIGQIYYKADKDKSPISTYIADHNYVIEDYTEMTEKFGITEQQAKKAVFYVRKVYYGEGEKIEHIHITPRFVRSL